MNFIHPRHLPSLIFFLDLRISQTYSFNNKKLDVCEYEKKFISAIKSVPDADITHICVLTYASSVNVEFQYQEINKYIIYIINNITKLKFPLKSTVLKSSLKYKLQCNNNVYKTDTKLLCGKPRFHW